MLRCASQDLTLHAVLSDGDNTCQVDPWVGANTRRKLVLTPGYNYGKFTPRSTACKRGSDRSGSKLLSTFT
jgi:hypothetical protein